MGARWTKEEEDYLIENYPKLGALACSKYLNRTEKAVFGKGNKLGLKARGKLRTNEEYLLELKTKGITIIPIEDYIGNNIPILHKCSNGHELSVQPGSVLSGIGCSKCYTISQSRTHEQYTKSVPYTVLDTYINSYTRLRHQCSENHIWEALPDTMLKGGRCPVCRPYKGFDSTKPGILYYIKIVKANLVYYKIGITNNTISQRFKEEPNSVIIKVIKETYYDSGAEARKEETRLLRKFKSYRQNIPELLVSGGNTELFEFDILGLDT